MKVNKFEQQSLDYQRIEKAIQYIEDNFTSQPNLDAIANSVHMSKFHFDRIFKRWVGITPVQFMQFLTLDYTKKKLRESQSILNAALDAGLSGTGRLHDLFVNFEAMTPGEYKRKAAGITITYGFSNSPFGRCLLARTERGICHLGFIDAENQIESLDHLYATWPGARFVENSESIGLIINRLFDVEKKNLAKPFNIHLKGTNFQINVWRALLNIPNGSIVSYQDIALLIGNQKAYRAVASAIANNPIAYLIPCHRVIAKSGKINQYRWGSVRKKAIIGWEAAHN